jgi:hypothetical protein
MTSADYSCSNNTSPSSNRGQPVTWFIIWFEICCTVKTDAVPHFRFNARLEPKGGLKIGQRLVSLVTYQSPPARVECSAILNISDESLGGSLGDVRAAQVNDLILRKVFFGQYDLVDGIDGNVIVLKCRINPLCVLPGSHEMRGITPEVHPPLGCLRLDHVNFSRNGPEGSIKGLFRRTE